MRIVKKATKALVIGFVLFNIVKPLSIPRLPPIEMLSETVSLVELS